MRLEPRALCKCSEADGAAKQSEAARQNEAVKQCSGAAAEQRCSVAAKPDASRFFLPVAAVTRAGGAGGGEVVGGVARAVEATAAVAAGVVAVGVAALAEAGGLQAGA